MIDRKTKMAQYNPHEQNQCNPQRYTKHFNFS